jgi:hypothetical protein
MGEELTSWLIENGWDVYPEVALYAGSPIADIVCRQGKLIWVIEMKSSLSLDVITQAHFWIRHANFSSVLVPRASANNRSSKNREAVRSILRTIGIGMLEYSDSGYYRGISESVKPSFRRKTSQSFFKVLNDGHKLMGVAGSNRGERWTPFKETVASIKEYLRLNPGATYEQLIGNIKYHWKTPSTARNCIKRYLDSGIISGIRVDTTEKKHKLYLGAVE